LSATLGAAVSASAGGDTILVNAGLYLNDFTTIGHALTIEGVGGLAHFLADTSPPNGKAIMTVDANLTIDHLEFSGAAVPDGQRGGHSLRGGQPDNQQFVVPRQPGRPAYCLIQECSRAAALLPHQNAPVAPSPRSTPPRFDARRRSAVT
jgi:hypothetical protein